MAARLEELLDAVQIKRMPFCSVKIVGDGSPVIDSGGVEVLVDGMQKCMSLVHASQLDVSMARYSVAGNLDVALPVQSVHLSTEECSMFVFITTACIFPRYYLNFLTWG